jgi:type I restriction enzyme S subunit
MSQYKPYTAYKNSNIDWIAEVPDHWIGGSLRWFAKIYAGGTPSKNIDKYWIDGTIPWLNSGSVNNAVITEPSAFITEEAFNSSSAKWIDKGALVMALAGQGRTKGTVAQLAIDTTCNQSMAAIVPGHQYNPRYLYWWLHSNYQNIRNMAGGDLRDGLNLELIGSIQCPIPPINEQDEIANKIDNEAHCIDTLIAKKTRFIELLKEKRQALITHAVTKGLNPDVPMKDSGIEWIGEVPEHWEVIPVKRTSSLRNERTGENSDGIRYIGLEDVQSESGKYQPTEGTSRQSDSSTVSVFYYGDVLYGKLRPYLKKAIVADMNGVCSTEFLVLKSKDVLPDLLQKWLLTSEVTQQIESGCDGAKMPRADWEGVGSIPIPVPPHDEQKILVERINQENIRIDALICKTQRSIELLKERRSAFITAAVTGQIDLRKES